MGKYIMGRILLINSAILISSVVGIKTALAQEVHPGSETTVAEKTPHSPATDLSKITPTAKIVKPEVLETKSSQPKIRLTAIATEKPTIAQATPVADKAVPVDTSNLEQMQPSSTNESGDDEPMDQVTNVSQFQDVQPSDWAYEALSRVVQTYGCLQGYPDGTFRGNRALSRYEFAAGLNACLRQIEAMIANQPNRVSRQDFDTLQRLAEDFRTELASLSTRVDNLERRTVSLEQHNFSPTTKLVGEAVIAATEAFGRNRATNRTGVLQDRVRLDLQSSFTGKDTLHTRITASNAVPLLNDVTVLPGPFNTGEGIQTFQLTGGSIGNGEVVDWIGYYLPIGSKAQLYVAGTAGLHSDYVFSTVSPYLDSFTGASGAISHYGEENPIYSIGGGAGAGFSYKVNNAIALTVGYLAGGNTSPANPSPGQGLFKGDYAGLAQINLNPSGKFQLGFTYVNSYHSLGGPIFNLGGGQPAGQGYGGGTAGTSYANNPVAALIGGSFKPIIANSYGAEASFLLTPKFAIGGWFSYTNAMVINSGINSGSAEIWNYAVTLAFPDLGKKGNLGGVIVGAEPYLGGFKNASLPSSVQNQLPLHVEGFYKYQLTDNVSITPGVIWLTAPNQAKNTPDAVIGTLRTTFTF